MLLEVIIDEKMLREILVGDAFELVVDVHGEVLAEYLWLEILVRVVLRLVVLCAWSRLIFVTDKEFVEDLQQFLNLVKRFKQLILLIDLCVRFLAFRLLSRLL